MIAGVYAGPTIQVSEDEILRKGDIVFYNSQGEIMPEANPELAVHATGAKRGTDLKDLKFFLMSPIAIRRYAAVMAEGAKKYGYYNWEKGFPISDLIDHTFAHLLAFLEGDRSEDHLGHALWNICAAVHSQEAWPHLNTDLRPAKEVGNCEEHCYCDIVVTSEALQEQEVNQDGAVYGPDYKYDIGATKAVSCPPNWTVEEIDPNNRPIHFTKNNVIPGIYHLCEAGTFLHVYDGILRQTAEGSVEDKVYAVRKVKEDGSVVHYNLETGIEGRIIAGNVRLCCFYDNRIFVPV